MSLEVRQLVLKATVADEDDDAEASGSSQARARGDTEASALDAELLKQEILAACRQWFQDALRQQRER